jgi:hypothetical protein
MILVLGSAVAQEGRLAEAQAALWDHFKVPASRSFAKALAALAAQAPDMALFDAAPLPVPMPSGRQR